MAQIHDKTFSRFRLFKEISDNSMNYISWITSYLKPQIFNSGQIVYTKDEEIDGLYYMTKGVSSFTLPEMS